MIVSAPDYYRDRDNAIREMAERPGGDLPRICRHFGVTEAEAREIITGRTLTFQRARTQAAVPLSLRSDAMQRKMERMRMAGNARRAATL